MLRLASSTVVPYALRAIASPRILSGSMTNAFSGCTQEYSLVKRENPKWYSHNFSTDAKKLSESDRILVQVVKSEIKSKHSSLNQSMPPPPADFPFTIQDNPHEIKLSLTRELGGEEIYVSVAMPEFIPEDDEDESQFRCRCGQTPPVLLYVRITKENGKMLDFGVSVSADKMSVSIMSVMEPVAFESKEHRLVCFGPHNVDDVDSDLQCALREYLEIRGIRKSDALFLYKYMVKKSKRDPLHALEKLKKFIEE